MTPQDEPLTHSSVHATPNTLEPLTDSFTNVHDNCIHHLFERQAQHHPDAVALVFNDQQLTYAQLNRLANRLAWALIEDGIRPEHRIAICVDRGLPMIVGALAVLKAGAAYVPLDPAYPAERLAGILQDAAPRLLLSDSGGRAALGEAALADQPTWDLTAQIGAPSPLESDRENPCPAGLSTHHLAYVIYTSGSTGTPKGVMVEHAQVVRLFDTSHAQFGFHESDTWCLFHSFAFDFSVWELWGALRYGGCLVIAPHAVTRSATDFYRLLCETGVTVLNQTPSAFKGLIDAQAQSALQHRLRYVIFGGEALEPAMLQPWYARHAEHSPQLINMYGITETTVHVTYHPLCAADCAQSGSVIGQALGDLKLYLLDTDGLPVATGEPGELYIGGAGVARGYLNRPELTAERFLRDPFDPSGEGRLYRSGDLARTLPDGNLLYLGRNDQQIKLSGFRIEPGEIAACLLRHPSVREAAVVAREDLPDGKQLIAYVVRRQVDNATFDHHGLREHLRTQLPNYMVPAAIVQVAALPLNLNGKLDSKALPAPDRDAYAHAVFEAPREGTEQSLAAIWQELLGIERVSRHDHFFDLGGNSLLATRLLGRLSAAHSIAPSFSALYDHPSLKEQGEWLDTRAVHDQVHNTRLIKPASQTERPLLSFAQQRMWLLSQLKESSAAYHIPLVLRLCGSLDLGASRQALQA